MCSYNMSLSMSVFHHETGFSLTSQLLFMFQCNERVEMEQVFV